MSYASLVFLAYNRPQFIFDAIASAVENAGYPVEVIVHDDGSSDPAIADGLLERVRRQEISHLILNVPGHNEGVGTAINRGFHLATGDPIVKLDQDLLFEPVWLARVVTWLRDDPAIGAMGLFRYHVDPVDWRKMNHRLPHAAAGYEYVDDFVSSAMAVPRWMWEALGPFEEHSDAFAEDVAYKQLIREHYELALPRTDLATNRGFGIGPSTVATPHGTASIHHGPFVCNLDLGQAAEVAEELLEEPRFRPGVVITAGPGREENLRRTIEHLMRVPRLPRTVVVVYDGTPALGFETPVPVNGVEIPKHQPGQEQPRNVGFRRLRELDPDCTHCWFLDSDLIFEPQILERFLEGLLASDRDRILIGPYDWLMSGVIEFVADRGDTLKLERKDYRWVSFDEHGPEDVLVHDLGSALACFGGNLIWPVGRFEEVGGFHPDLHHGRCEDGELGLRAASAGVPMSFVRHARAWHVWHPQNDSWKLGANMRDVPLLEQWHPWVRQQGLIVTANDGARFEWRCPQCGEQVNTLEYWEHAGAHRVAT